jgi:hypothetical protein
VTDFTVEPGGITTSALLAVALVGPRLRMVMSMMASLPLLTGSVTWMVGTRSTLLAGTCGVAVDCSEELFSQVTVA